jgi:hypothetical protein
VSVIFWDVDTQHDFMRSDGLLYVPDSEAIIPALAALTGFAHRENIPIVATADDHDPAHRELSEAPDFLDTFPPHCMRGTPGQAKIPETALRDPLVIEPEPEDPAALGARIRAHRGDFLLVKHWFDVFTNANIGVLLDALAPSATALRSKACSTGGRRRRSGSSVTRRAPSGRSRATHSSPSGPRAACVRCPSGTCSSGAHHRDRCRAARAHRATAPSPLPHHPPRHGCARVE